MNEKVKKIVKWIAVIAAAIGAAAAVILEHCLLYTSDAADD